MLEVPVEYLREALLYDPETGELVWSRRPRWHFSSVTRWKSFNMKFPGRRAGWFDDKGYCSVSITIDGVLLSLKVHRIAWVLMTGAWPLKEIDHVNGVRGDNRFKNLRVGTSAENRQNQKLSPANTSGFLGVSRIARAKGRSKWRAEIKVLGRRYHLGYWPTPLLAYSAYLEAKARLHTFNPVPRAA